MRILPAALGLALSAAALAVSPLMAKPATKAAHAQHHSVLAQVLADPRRDADRARDAWRHPAETIGFFGIEPGMTVVDVMPTGGWWTRVLVPYLGANGRYIGLNPDVRNASDGMKRNYSDLAVSFPAQAAGWTGVPAERIGAYNTDTLPAELNGTVDRYLVFREMHNLWRTNLLRGELLAARRLLKSDGLLGIEQHRAKPGSPFDYTNGSNGYLREQDVIALVEAHGFQLVAKSEINANPRDPANHKEGVWMLPPNFNKVSEADKPRYQAIGESDRMTLLFRKRP